ncbi:MAG: acetyl-CoA synthetase [Acidimicrobiales bacterium]|nr:MAG: acetyl-CoA synthetase [Acidimicrobiales bacterium]
MTASGVVTSLDKLFEPRGVVVVGASTHPGKFGFVALHNILSAGFQGRVAAVNRDGGTVLGLQTVKSLADLEPGAYDLAFVCTPPSTLPEIVDQAAAIGVSCVYLTTAGFREASEDGARAEAALVQRARERGVVLIGPNGQGVVSTPVGLWAQIVAPYPPRGSIGIVSQSGNFVSSFMNLARFHEVGVSRAVSVGNAAMVSVADVLEWLAEDPHTSVCLAYVEGVGDGRRFREVLSATCRRKPVVLVKGGATERGARAASSHTGSLATDHRTFTGVCRQAGAVLVDDVERAFDMAAAFATMPLPKGPRLVVVSTVGGWGVVAADTVSRTALDLLELPDDLRCELDSHLPARWSRNNPIDLAGGETRDTVPQVLETVAKHPDVDSVVLLGVGIQSNQGRAEREGPFWPGEGLDRIVAFHERQDRRYVRTALDLAREVGKPIAVATELAIADRSNPAIREAVAAGGFVFPSAQRAVVALGEMWRHARRVAHD